MNQVIIVGHPDHNGDGFGSTHSDPFSSSHLFSDSSIAQRAIWARIDPSDIGGGTSFFPTTEAKTVHLQSTAHVAVSFDNANVDNQLVTKSLQTAFNQIVDSVNGLTSVNISATTNGHAPDSNHGVGDAVDINFANGVHIGTTGEGYVMATKLENAAMANPNVRFVEGPMGNFARASETSSWVASANLGPSQYTHVHFDVFPKK